jgi:hypothetical protein
VFRKRALNCFNDLNNLIKNIKVTIRHPYIITFQDLAISAANNTGTSEMFTSSVFILLT